MPFQLSPGVNVTEIDLTTVIPAVATNDAAIGGVFRWGPVDKVLLVDSEELLAARYGKPTNDNAETFFTAASFLAYSNRLWVSRAHGSSGFSLKVSAGATAESDQLVIASTSTGISVGDVIIGPNIPEGTTVESITVGGTTDITMTKNYTGSTTTIEVNFLNPSYSLNAIANSGPAALSAHIVKNEDHWEEAQDTLEADVQFIARYPGAMGNSLNVSVCDSSKAFEYSFDLGDIITVHEDPNQLNLGAIAAASSSEETITFVVGSNTAVVDITSADTASAQEVAEALAGTNGIFRVGDVIKVGNTSIGYQYVEISSISAAAAGASNDATVSIGLTERYALSTDFVFTDTDSITRLWKHWNLFEQAPGQSSYQLLNGNSTVSDEIHVVIEDVDGKVSGVPGTILETWSALSRATDGKTADGSSNYIFDVLNNNSAYVWYANDIRGTLAENALNLADVTQTFVYTKDFVAGKDVPGENDAGSLASVLRSYDKFASPEDIDVSLVLTGKSRGGTNGEQTANYIIDNITEKRKDCVAFVSPEKADVVGNTGGDIEQDVVTFRNSSRSTSYAVIDGGYKYMYDKYNDLYRWIPLNGDTAGLCAQTDNLRDAWWSPAGFNRGNLKNVIKLAYNPRKAQRDVLYKNGVNPVVNFPGQGIILYGDKTMLSRPSAFDRINVRRLFIVLEKAIATAAKFMLFEFNDEFTRASFVNLVTPFLRDVQGRRGIYDFHVVCDETNNTGEVIDRNEFVGDIYIKPARSINFIQLNFIAVRTGVEFSEVIGRF